MSEPERLGDVLARMYGGVGPTKPKPKPEPKPTEKRGKR
jgi:hypothetical protein